MESPALRPDLSVEEILAHWPQTLTVFIEFRMLCVGCPITRFHTLCEACIAHGISLAPVELALQAAVNSGLRLSPEGDVAARQ